MKQRNLCAALLSIVSASTLAQTSGPMLEEVIVTAQKRAQNLQDVPVSVIALGGQAMAEQNMLNFEDLARSIPNFEVAEFDNQTQVTMRGITSQYNSGIENAVGLFIDGVHQSRDRMYRSPFLDADRVEVLRGPQGTLFGKNTTAGAVQIFTKRPTNELEASIAGTYTFDSGDHNGEYNVEGAISGPLTDTLSARFAGRYYDSDGYFDNVFLNEDQPQKEVSTSRLSLMWEPSSDFTAVFKYETSESETEGLGIRTDSALDAVNLVVDALAIPGFTYADSIALYEDANQTDVPFVEGEFVRATNPDYDETNSDAYTLTLEASLGEYEFVSITGYSEFDVTFRRDADYIGLDALSQYIDQDYDGFSQEFRLLSPSSDSFEYIVGLYYQDTDFVDDQLLNQDWDQLLGGVGESIPGFTLGTDYSADSEAWSAFGQATWYATDRLTFVFGLRYGEEDKSADRSMIANYFKTDTPISEETDPGLKGLAEFLLGEFGFEVPHYVEDDRSVDDLSPSLKVQYDILDDTMIYASYGEAVKSGGFDSQAEVPEAFEFDDEDTVSYEVGTKGTYLDGRLRANLALFYMEITDEQVSRFQGVTTTIGNIGEAEYQGVEFDMNTLLTESLTLDLSAAYLEGERTKADFAPELEGDLEVPDWTANMALNHQTDIFQDLELRSMLKVEYMSDRKDSDLPGGEVDSFTIVDARIALAADSGRWELALIGQNLTDEEVILGGGSIPVTEDDAGYNIFVRPPRSYGLQLLLNL